VIVDCAAYTDGARVEGGIATEDVADWLPKPETFVWLGLHRPDRDEIADVSRCFGLDDLYVDNAVAVHDRPVLSIEDGRSWLVLRTARYDDQTEQIRIGELSLLFDERMLLSVRYGQATPLVGVRHELEKDEDWLRLGPAAVVATVVSRVIDDYRPALDGFEKDVVEVEREVFAQNREFPTSRLFNLKRQVLDLLLITDALHDPLTRLLRVNPAMRRPEIAAEMHEALEQLDRVVTRARILSDLIDSAVDLCFTQVSLQQNEDMRKISSWVAIGALPTLVAGFYGMNFTHMPELDSPYGYPIVIIFLIIGCSLLYRTFRRTGWL
jgi:magnesium transporter